jgi:Zn-dependent membrane protease YugP
MYPFFYFDPTYLLCMVPAILLTLGAQIYVSSAYRKWSKVPARSQLSGAQAAQRLIQYANLYNVQIQGVRGNLTDHYDPRSKVLRLSEKVYSQPSVASIAIAAHELGHAMQDAEGYGPLRFRAMLVPAVNIGSYLGWIFIIVGLLFNFTGLAWLGVLVFGLGALFAFATIPVEFDASARAKRVLVESGIIMGEDEQRGVNAVLNAAALTYVAALFTAIMQLLYYASLVLGSSGRRR